MRQFEAEPQTDSIEQKFLQGQYPGLNLSEPNLSLYEDSETKETAIIPSLTTVRLPALDPAYAAPSKEKRTRVTRNLNREVPKRLLLAVGIVGAAALGMLSVGLGQQSGTETVTEGQGQLLDPDIFPNRLYTQLKGEAGPVLSNSLLATTQEQFSRQNEEGFMWQDDRHSFLYGHNRITTVDSILDIKDSLIGIDSAVEGKTPNLVAVSKIAGVEPGVSVGALLAASGALTNSEVAGKFNVGALSDASDSVDEQAFKDEIGFDRAWTSLNGGRDYTENGLHPWDIAIERGTTDLIGTIAYIQKTCNCTTIEEVAQELAGRMAEPVDAKWLANVMSEAQNAYLEDHLPEWVKDQNNWKHDSTPKTSDDSALSIELKNDSSPSMSAEGFSKWLKDSNYPPASVENIGQSVYEYAKTYKIDNAIVAAIYKHEGQGVTVDACNPGNIRADGEWLKTDKTEIYDNTDDVTVPYSRFDELSAQNHDLFLSFCKDGWAYGFESVFKLLREVYANKDLNTVDKVFPVYAPPGDNNDVSSYIKDVKEEVINYKNYK